MPEPTPRRDLVVVGASIGGVDTICRLLQQLPPDFPAALLIVQHTSPAHESRLAALFARSCQLPVGEARDGDRPLPGRVYVAPADQHMLLSRNGLRVARGPRENRSRPAIDPLFRSAAVVGRNRTIGVILSGSLDDGASGLAQVHHCGGVTVVEEPNTAIHPGMSLAALRAAPADFVVPVEKMGELLTRLVSERPPPAPAVPTQIELEARLTEGALEPAARPEDASKTGELGELSAYVCPDCGGPLWQITGEDRYRCYVGHAYSLQSLVQAQDSQLESALWAAVRSLEARQKMLQKLLQTEKAPQGPGGRRYLEEAEQSGRYASTLRELLLNLKRGAGEINQSYP